MAWGGGRRELGVEESSSRLSGSSEPPGLRLEAGSPPGYTALLPNSRQAQGHGSVWVSCCTGGGGLRKEWAWALRLHGHLQWPGHPNPGSCFVPGGPSSIPSVCLDTECRLPQREGAVLTALGGPWQGWAG